jgi:hypothetical protein
MGLSRRSRLRTLRRIGMRNELHCEERAVKVWSCPGMKKPVGLNKIDYPEKTEGSEIAAYARKAASKLSAEERAEQLREAMAKVYGAKPKETARSGH